MLKLDRNKIPNQIVEKFVIPRKTAALSNFLPFLSNFARKKNRVPNIHILGILADMKKKTAVLLRLCNMFGAQLIDSLGPA